MSSFYNPFENLSDKRRREYYSWTCEHDPSYKIEDLMTMSDSELAAIDLRFQRIIEKYERDRNYCCFHFYTACCEQRREINNILVERHDSLTRKEPEE